ncbi:UNVERIFIED_CONTAM: hypothetical protein O8I53_06530 [Campylobacter lari]
MKTLNLMSFEKLMKFLEELKINYSLSQETINFFYAYGTDFNEKNIRICLYYEDFILLHKKFSNYFIYNEENPSRNLAPFFTVYNEKIFIDLLIPTNDLKLKKLKNKFFYNHLILNGDNKKNIFL